MLLPENFRGSDEDAALFIKETASNIIAHGKTKGRKKISADYCISENCGKISITLRDCCETLTLQRSTRRTKTTLPKKYQE